MQVVYERCGGLDAPGRERDMTRGLLEMVRWLEEKGVAAVAMESPGTCWKPIYNLLGGTGIKAMVVNACDIKNVPGRKTDSKDAELLQGKPYSPRLRGLRKASQLINQGGQYQAG